MPLRAFVHPLAALVFAISIVVGLFVEQLAPWSGRFAWFLAWGFAAYAALVVAGIRREAINSRGAPSRSQSSDFQSVPRHTAPRASPPDQRADAVDLTYLTQDALQHLNRPDLGERLLAHHLPRTVSAFVAHAPGAQDHAVSPVMLTAALRAALVTCIEQLRSAGTAASETDALRFALLHEAYVLGRSTRSIQMRYSISESTFHRYRREAIRVLADCLVSQEELLPATE